MLYVELLLDCGMHRLNCTPPKSHIHIYTPTSNISLHQHWDNNNLNNCEILSKTNSLFLVYSYSKRGKGQLYWWKRARKMARNLKQVKNRMRKTNTGGQMERWNVEVGWQFGNFSRGIFLVFFCMYFIQHCFICRPSDSTVSDNAGIEPRPLATLALVVTLYTVKKG